MLGYICIYSGSLCSYVYTHARFDRIKVQVFVTYNNYVWVSVCVNIYIYTDICQHRNIQAFNVQDLCSSSQDQQQSLLRMQGRVWGKCNCMAVSICPRFSNDRFQNIGLGFRDVQGVQGLQIQIQHNRKPFSTAALLSNFEPQARPDREPRTAPNPQPQAKGPKLNGPEPEATRPRNP